MKFNVLNAGDITYGIQLQSTLFHLMKRNMSTFEFKRITRFLLPSLLNFTGCQ